MHGLYGQILYRYTHKQSTLPYGKFNVSWCLVLTAQIGTSRVIVLTLVCHLVSLLFCFLNFSCNKKRHGNAMNNVERKLWHSNKQLQFGSLIVFDMIFYKFNFYKYRVNFFFVQCAFYNMKK